MSSEICVSLDQSKILSSGYELSNLPGDLVMLSILLKVYYSFACWRDFLSATKSTCFETERFHRKLSSYDFEQNSDWVESIIGKRMNLVISFLNRQ